MQRFAGEKYKVRYIQVFSENADEMSHIVNAAVPI